MRFGNSLAVAAALALGFAALGQDARPGAIAGRLLDPNGAVVTGLDTPIYVRSRATGREYSAAVSRDGEYSVTGLPAGAYDLHFPISCCMYRTYAQENVTIDAAQTTRLDLNLLWGINLGTIGDDPGMLSNDMRAQASDVNGPTPRTPDGKPDLAGVWYNIPPAVPRPTPRQKAWAADIQKQLNDLKVDPNAGAYCLPQSAVPTTLMFPYKLVQTPGLLVQLTEFVTPGFRQIFLDGRSQPEFWNPAWLGHSRGHWEGDTLVVETTGFNETTPGFGIHTEKLRVIERYRRPTFGQLLIEVTAEDPDAYEEPLAFTIEAGIAAEDQEILEFVCAENNTTQMNVGGQPWRGRP